MRFQGIKKKHKRKWLIQIFVIAITISILPYILVLDDGSWINDDAQRPMESAVDRNKDHFLLKHVDGLVFRPLCDILNTFVERGVEMRREDMHLGTIRVPRHPVDA